MMARSSSLSTWPLPSLSYTLNDQRSLCSRSPRKTRLRAATNSRKSMVLSWKNTSGTWEQLGHGPRGARMEKAFTVSPRFCQRLETCFRHSRTPLPSGPRRRSAWTRAETDVRSGTPWQTSYTCPEVLWRRSPHCSLFAASAPWPTWCSTVHGPAAWPELGENLSVRVLFYNRRGIPKLQFTSESGD